MKDPFDAGHKQLFEAGCSGLSAAWRRAAENSVEHLHDRAATPQLREAHGTRALLAAAAVSLVARLCFIAASTLGPVEQASVDATVTATPSERPEPQAANSVADTVLAQFPLIETGSDRFKQVGDQRAGRGGWASAVRAAATNAASEATGERDRFATARE